MKYDLNETPKSLLTYGNPKILKGTKKGYLTAVMHFAPANLAGFEVCAFRTAGCSAACLNTAGRGGIALDKDGLNAIQAARIRRTRFWKNDKPGFATMLDKEIQALIRRAKRLELTPALRLNGTSDIPWENVKFTRAGKVYANIMAAYPGLQFYDYTKNPNRADLPHNYHLTFSLAEDNDAHAKTALDNGMSVAVVFDTKKADDFTDKWTFAGKVYPVIDGDESDLRFLDKAGSIVGLRAKGAGKKDDSGFVRRLDIAPAVV